MSLFRSRLVPVVAAAALLVGTGAFSAEAARSLKPVLLGVSNHAAKATKISTTKGPALVLKTRSGQAPLKVTSDKLVRNLNADTVDGKSASDLGSRSYTFTLPSAAASTSFTWGFDALPNGDYLASYDILGKTATAPVTCYFRAFTSSPSRGGQSVSSPTGTGGVTNNSATTTVGFQQPALKSILHCDSSSAFSINSDYISDPVSYSYSSTVTFVRVDDATYLSPN